MFPSPSHFPTSDPGAMWPVFAPSPGPVFFGNQQRFVLGFAPDADEMDIVMMWSEGIYDTLEEITKIDREYWQFGWTNRTSIMGEDYYDLIMAIENNLHTKAKMRSLKKMIDYDNGEQFKTIFNAAMPSWMIMMNTGEKGYIINVWGLDDILDQDDVLELEWQSSWNEAPFVLGWGALRSYRNAGPGDYFCTDQVRLRFHVELDCGFCDFPKNCR